LFLIDCVSSKVEKRDHDTIFLPVPVSLTSLSILLNILAENNDVKFFIFLNLEVMMLYNPETCAKFFISNLAKFFNKNKITIIFSINLNEKDSNVKLIMSVCDKTIKVS